MRKPRWVQHFIACLFGYFWAPCPVCGQMFGGQEFDPHSPFLMTADGTQWMVCSDCFKDGTLAQAQAAEDAKQYREPLPLAKMRGMVDTVRRLPHADPRADGSYLMVVHPGWEEMLDRWRGEG